MKRVTASAVAKEVGCTVAQVGAAHGFYVGCSMAPERAAKIRETAERMGFKRCPRTYTGRGK